MSNAVRRFLLCHPKGEAFRCVVPHGPPRTIERRNQSWMRVATTIASLSPTRIEVLDRRGSLLRATKWPPRSDPTPPIVQHEPSDDPRFMTVAEVAAEVRCSLSTVRQWLRTGYLTSVKLGKHRRVSRSDFERLLGNRETVEDRLAEGDFAPSAFKALESHVHRLVQDQRSLMAFVIGLNVRVRELMAEHVQQGRLEPGVYRGTRKSRP